MPALIALAFALFVAADALATTWVLVGDSLTMTAEVDRDGITREGPIAKAWSRWNYAPAQYTPGDGKAYQSVKILNLYNCTTRQYAIAQQTAYAGPNGSGEVVFADTVPTSRLQYSEVTPETIGENSLVYVCKQTRKKQ